MLQFELIAQPLQSLNHVYSNLLATMYSTVVRCAIKLYRSVCCVHINLLGLLNLAVFSDAENMFDVKSHAEHFLKHFKRTKSVTESQIIGFFSCSSTKCRPQPKAATPTSSFQVLILLISSPIEHK